MSATQTTPRHKLWDLIMDIRLAMLVTRDGGLLRSRPLLSHPDEKDGVIWFLTAKSDSKVMEILNEQAVNLSYMDMDHSHFVSVSGKAYPTLNRAKLDEVWSPYSEAWFPEGKDDPELVMIKIVPEQAEYWDMERREMLTLAEFLEAARDGRLEDIGENRKIDRP